VPTLEQIMPVMQYIGGEPGAHQLLRGCSHGFAIQQGLATLGEKVITVART